MNNAGRKTRGRQRVPLERMEKDRNRSATFVKRRAGVFKKMSELVTLCGVQALCIVFSAANKAFAYGHPSVEAIIKRFLGENNNLPQENRVSNETSQNETLLRSNMEVSLLRDQINIEKKRSNELLQERKLKSEEAQRFLEPPETFTYSELKQIQATLIVLKNNVLTHGRNLEAQSKSNPNTGPSTLDGQNSQEQNSFLNPPNTLVGQNYNPNPNLVQSHTTPTFGDSSHMTMVPPPLVTRNPNDNISMAMIPTPVSTFNGPTLAMRSNFMNTGFTHTNIPQAFQGPTNLIPGSFDGQNTMLPDMGWNPMPGQTFTHMLMGEGSSNPSNPPFNPQGGFGFGPQFDPGMN